MTGKTARRLYHALGGAVLPILGLVLSREALLVFTGSVAAIFVLVEAVRLLVPSVNQSLMSLFSGVSSSFKEREAVGPIGTTYFLVGSFLTFLLFPQNIAVLALFFTAVGDPAAAEVGERFGRLRLGKKSAEGAFAFFAVSLVVGLILLWAGLRTSGAALAVGALVACLVEVAPIPINDNLTVPVASAAAMTLMP